MQIASAFVDDGKNMALPLKITSGMSVTDTFIT
jgi:hypothetical protein